MHLLRLNSSPFLFEVLASVSELLLSGQFTFWKVKVLNCNLFESGDLYFDCPGSPKVL